MVQEVAQAGRQHSKRQLQGARPLLETGLAFRALANREMTLRDGCRICMLAQGWPAHGACCMRIRVRALEFHGIPCRMLDRLCRPRALEQTGVQHVQVSFVDLQVPR